MKLKLKCCGKTNPIGVDKEHLRLSFETEGDTEILSYEIKIASSEKKLTEGKYDIGIFKNQEASSNEFWLEQAYFKERTKYFWQIAAQTKEGSFDSDIGFFETGIGNWSADWICAKKSNQNVHNFKKEFSVSGDVREARLYICGLGYFNACINGKPVDDAYYKPLVTDYATRNHPENCYLHDSSSHRVTYYTYDATELLQEGTNELSVDVANGYYCNTDRLPFELNYSFDRVKLIFELHITEEDRKCVIKSGVDTLVREQNYASTLYMGDYVDFTKKCGAYEKAALAEAPDGKPVGPQCEDDHIREVISPISEKLTSEGVLYDFGMNHTGGLKIRLEAEEGDELIIRYAEVLGEEGLPNYETSAWHDRNPHTGQTIDIYQENWYVLKKGINEITPLFSWYCYRYVTIVKPDTVQIQNIESLFICTGVETNGHFECSEEILNRTNEMFLQTLFCNMHSGLVTDCPHREKRPYTGDGQVIMKASWYNLDTTAFYYKWLDDLIDSQTPEGLIPNSAPDFGGGGGYAWGNAICFVTKYLYQFTGDKEVAKKGYRAIKKWLSYYQAKRDENYIIRSGFHEWMLGDWLAPDTVISNIYYISTVCYLMAVDTAIYFAEIYEVADLKKWKQLREQIVTGINKVFFDKDKLSYGNGVQGEDVLALATDIVPNAYKRELKDKIEHHYRKETDYHLDTGIVLTPILIEYLTNHGYEEIAYRIMTAKTYPSYYNLMENDTTFSEHWSKKWPDYYVGDSNSRLIKGGGDLSHCHPMYGSVCSWLYERVAGLDLTGLWKKEVGIHPYFTDCLEWAKADKMVTYGKVSVHWKKEKEGLTLQVKMPKGLTGICSFPSQYKELKCMNSGEIFSANENGYFQFEISGGEWTFQAINKKGEISYDN